MAGRCFLPSDQFLQEAALASSTAKPENNVSTVPMVAPWWPASTINVSTNNVNTVLGPAEEATKGQPMSPLA